MHPAGKHYKNQNVRLADLVVLTDVIEGVTFENVTLVGPAVVIFQGQTELNRCGFEGDPESTLWPLGSRARALGAILLLDCKFYTCRFSRIGIAYPPEAESSIRSGLGLS